MNEKPLRAKDRPLGKMELLLAVVSLILGTIALLDIPQPYRIAAAVFGGFALILFLSLLMSSLIQEGLEKVLQPTVMGDRVLLG